jgi:hypothetical protein
MISFIPDDSFGWIHHRFLNRLNWLEALATHAGKRPGYVDLAEGDVCWFREGGSYVAYLHHPKLLSPPSPDEARRRIEGGEFPLLIDVLDDRFAHIPFVVELKTGDGPDEEAISAIVEMLEERRPGNYWVDSFSPRQLALVKKAGPGALTSLHTRNVLGGRVLKTAYEFFPLSLPRLAALPQVDIVTATYKYSLARPLSFFGATIDSMHESLAREGKELAMGGIYSPEALKVVKNSRAVGGNVRFDSDVFKVPAV